MMLSAYAHTLTVAATAIWIYMTVWFVIAVAVRRNDVADIAWGPGFLVASITALISNHNCHPLALLATGLVAVWGTRLSLHIGTRNLRKPEDYRYQTWRKSWGQWFYLRSYLQIFFLQGFLMLIVVSPVLMVVTNGGDLTGVSVIGALIWLGGFLFESIGDQQLRQFIANPQNAGRIMDHGLWRYTRHPNYFGEVTQWWGIAILALSLPYGSLALIGPATITFLILKVSGVPLLEAKYAGNAAYESYQNRTSVLIPLPPRQTVK